VRMTETERNLFSTPLWLGSTVSGLSCWTQLHCAGLDISFSLDPFQEVLVDK
jgi:hypothetical protein